MSSRIIARAARKILRRFEATHYGQVRKHHEIGKWIEFISSLPNVNVIVEIGTWNGKGTSRAIVRGVKSRSNASRSAIKVVGYEINPKLVNIAKKTLRKYPFFEVVFGSIVSVNALDRSNLNASEILWIDQDELWIKNAPNVLGTVPSVIDLLVLDGGEFSTLSEFKLLSPRVEGWVVLDDIKTRKCCEIMNLVRKGNDFNIVYESNERHGTAILKKISGINA